MVLATIPKDRNPDLCLEPCAMSLFRKHAPFVKNSPYLLLIITHIGENEYGQYQRALRLYNYHLHQLSKKLGMKEHLSSYVARQNEFVVR